MSNIIWRIFPYVGITLSGLMALGAIIILISPDAKEPSQISIDDLRESAELPTMLEIKGGILDWTESVVYSRDTRGLKLKEAVVAPYMHASAAFSNAPAHTKPCLLVKWVWDDFQEEFPDVARFLAMDDAGQAAHMEQLAQAVTTPYTLKAKVDSAPSGRDETTVKSFKQEGYNVRAFVNANAEPVTRGDGAITLSFFAAVGYGFFRWIRHRRTQHH